MPGDAPTAVSLFSGCGGLDLGLHRAGFRHLLMCESDAYRRDVLAARFPGVPIYEDVCSLDAVNSRADYGQRQGWLGRVGAVDLLCGGFPCQDLSVAGRRAGLDGDRSGLFFEYARIAESLRPRWLLVENVPGLLSSQGGRDFGIVLATLADLGYGLAWRILDSRFFGVPQRRRRVFIVGTLADGDPRAAAERAGQVLAVGTRCPGHPPTGRKEGPDVAGTLGNGSRGSSGGGSRSTDLDGHGAYVTYTLKSEGHDASEDGTGRGVPLVAAQAVRRLTPIETERLQDLPDDWTQLGGTPDSRRYSAVGDAVTASVGEWVGARLREQLQ